MYTIDYEYHKFDNFRAQTTNKKTAVHFSDPGMVIEKNPTSDLVRKDNISTYDQKNRFFQGLIIATPATIALWGIIIFMIKRLF